MIRANLIPQHTDIQISIPKEYIGKRVEVLLYTLEEIREPQKPTYKLSDLWGKLSDESAQELHQASTEMRNEWSKDI